MKTAIITSNKDTASMNIRENLLKYHSFEKTEKGYDSYDIYRHIDNAKTDQDTILVTANKESLDCEDIDKEIDADFFIFATRHQSSAGTPSLSVHTPGNWSQADCGGRGEKLCISPALHLRAAYLDLLENAKCMEHEITVEQTHHGPYIKKPCMFIEIGSCKEYWKDTAAGKIIADCIIRLINNKDIDKQEIKTAMVLGGGHYNQVANKIMARTDIAIGHICAKFLLGKLDVLMLKQAIEKHTTKVDMIILDWKGLGQHKKHVNSLLEEIDMPVKRAKKLLKGYKDDI